MNFQEAIDWAKNELLMGERWLAGEVSIFGNAFLAHLKLVVPEAEHKFVASLQDLIKQEIMAVEKEFTDPSQKFDTALERVFKIVAEDGVAGIKAIITSQALKETAIQIGVSALKAGMFAIL